MTTNAQAIDLYGDLHEALDDAYWASSNGEHRDIIQGINSAIFREIRALQKQEMENRTAEYRIIQVDLDRLKGKLLKLKQEIDDMVARVDLASKVVKIIGDVLEKLLP